MIQLQNSEDSLHRNHMGRNRACFKHMKHCNASLSETAAFREVVGCYQPSSGPIHHLSYIEQAAIFHLTTGQCSLRQTGIAVSCSVQLQRGSPNTVTFYIFSWSRSTAWPAMARGQITAEAVGNHWWPAHDLSVHISRTQKLWHAKREPLNAEEEEALSN